MKKWGVIMDYTTEYDVQRFTVGANKKGRLIWLIFCLILTVSYALEVVKGLRGIGYYLIFLLMCWCPFLIGVAKILPHPKAASGDLQPGQAGASRIPGDLVHPGGEILGILLFGGVGIQNIQQPIHSLKLQRRAEAAGEEPPSGNERAQIAGGHGAGFQIAFQKCLVAQGGSLRDLPRICAKIHAAGAQLLL